MKAYKKDCIEYATCETHITQSIVPNQILLLLPLLNDDSGLIIFFFFNTNNKIASSNSWHKILTSMPQRNVLIHIQIYRKKRIRCVCVCVSVVFSKVHLVCRNIHSQINSTAKFFLSSFQCTAKN